MSERTPEHFRRIALGKAGYSALTNRGTSFTLMVPKELARQLPLGTMFKAEWHAEGILFRYIENPPEPEITVDDMPDWMRRSLRPGHPGRIDTDE